MPSHGPADPGHTRGFRLAAARGHPGCVKRPHCRAEGVGPERRAGGCFGVGRIRRDHARPCAHHGKGIETPILRCDKSRRVTRHVPFFATPADDGYHCTFSRPASSPEALTSGFTVAHWVGEALSLTTGL